MTVKRIKEAAVLLMCVCVVFAFSFHSEADISPIYLCLILDEDSIDGCEKGTSPFDQVLEAMSRTKTQITVYYDALNIQYNNDYASSLMKSAAYGISFGTYATDDETLKTSLAYQKYVVKTSSRLVLGTGSSRNNELYLWELEAVSDFDLESPDFTELIQNRSHIGVVLDEGNAARISSFLETMKDTGYYIVTPTQYGEQTSGGN